MLGEHHLLEQSKSNHTFVITGKKKVYFVFGGCSEQGKKYTEKFEILCLTAVFLESNDDNIFLGVLL